MCRIKTDTTVVLSQSKAESTSLSSESEKALIPESNNSTKTKDTSIISPISTSEGNIVTMHEDNRPKNLSATALPIKSSQNNENGKMTLMIPSPLKNASLNTQLIL